MVIANGELYAKELRQLIETPEWKDEPSENAQYRRDLIQRAIDIANGMADVSQRR